MNAVLRRSSRVRRKPLRFADEWMYYYGGGNRVVAEIVTPPVDIVDMPVDMPVVDVPVAVVAPFDHYAALMSRSQDVVNYILGYIPRRSYRVRRPVVRFSDLYVMYYR